MSLDAVLDSADIHDPQAREHYRAWLPIERRQGEFFASLVLEHLPPRLDAAMRDRASALDFGCSCGHLVQRLSGRYPDARVEGIDVERIRIEVARHEYPSCVFHLADIETLGATYDVIFSSNVLEHFSAPLDVLQRLIAPHARRFIVSLVPYREKELSPGHLFSFDQSSFPERLGDFHLIHRVVIDCRIRAPDCWQGHQVLTVYAREWSPKSAVTRALGAVRKVMQRFTHGALSLAGPAAGAPGAGVRRRE